MAVFGAPNCQYTTKADARHKAQLSTKPAIEPNACYRFVLHCQTNFKLKKINTMSNIKFFKDHAGHNSAYRLNFGEEGSKDWNGTSILFAGYMSPISKHAIMLVEFKKLPHFFKEFDYHNLWRNIQGFCEEITEEEFNKIANEKFLSIVSGS